MSLPANRKSYPEKRAAKRRRQREAGYQGVKKAGRPSIERHNSGRMDNLSRKGEVRERQRPANDGPLREHLLNTRQQRSK